MTVSLNINQNFFIEVSSAVKQESYSVERSKGEEIIEKLQLFTADSSDNPWLLAIRTYVRPFACYRQ